MAADLGRVPVGPSPLDECPAGERVADCGDGALTAAFATGVLTGGEAQSAHELSGVVATSAVAECSHDGDGDGELDAAPGLESLDDRVQAPSLDLLAEFGLEAREPCLMCRHGSDVGLEDHLLGRRGTDPLSEPAQRGWPPGGTARIPAILTPQEGLQPGLRGLESPDRILPGAAEVADGLVLDRRDIDRGQIAGAHEPGRRGRVERC